MVTCLGGTGGAKSKTGGKTHFHMYFELLNGVMGRWKSD